MKDRVAYVAAVLALVLAVFAPVALAARGGGGGGGGKPSGGSSDPNATIELVPVTTSSDGLVHVLQKVTFKVYTTATQYPYVTVDCYDPSGAWVYHASNGMFPSSLNQVFTLGSNTWLSGEADCTAWLQKWDTGKRSTVTNLKSTSFHVYA
jgi:hypothetical protein